MISIKKFKIQHAQLFMLAMLVVNAGNYLYNLLLGRFLGPEAFADAALLITLLLVLSFIGMTFQIVSTKFVVELNVDDKKVFIKKAFIWSFLIGILLGLIIFFSSGKLHSFLNTSTPSVFKWLALGVPFYFVMSINRGIFQGEQNMAYLGITYLTEMLARFIITFVLLYAASEFHSSLSVAFAIFISFLIGLFPLNKSLFNLRSITDLTLPQKQIVRFFLLTLFYEFTLIIINNSDILLVKSYFDNFDAGLYASLALIGRVVYFVTWMFVMILLPKVIEAAKNDENTKPILFKNLLMIAGFSGAIVLGAFIFPELAVKILFGDAFLKIAPLLWQYALATALFAVANLFAYYFLSLNKYIPVILSAIFGLTQIVLIINFHETLQQVVLMQIIAMSALLIFQILYFLFETQYIASRK